jgi:hypothetical protein
MEGEVSAWLIMLDQLVIPLALLVLTPVLTALANRAIAALQEKTKIDLSKQQEEALERMLHEAIHFAEEQAHKAIKGETGDLNGSSKMEKAVSYIKTKGKVLQLDDIADAKSEELAALIEAKIFHKRVDPGSLVKPTPSAPTE